MGLESKGIGGAKGICYLHHDCSPPVILLQVCFGNAFNKKFQYIVFNLKSISCFTQSIFVTFYYKYFWIQIHVVRKSLIYCSHTIQIVKLIKTRWSTFRLHNRIYYTRLDVRHQIDKIVKNAWLCQLCDFRIARNTDP